MRIRIYWLLKTRISWLLKTRISWLLKIRFFFFFLQFFLAGFLLVLIFRLNYVRLRLVWKILLDFRLQKALLKSSLAGGRRIFVFKALEEAFELLISFFIECLYFILVLILVRKDRIFEQMVIIKAGVMLADNIKNSLLSLTYFIPGEILTLNSGSKNFICRSI